MTLESTLAELESGGFDLTSTRKKIGSIRAENDTELKMIETLSYAEFRRMDKKDLLKKKCKVFEIVSGKGAQSLDAMESKFFFIIGKWIRGMAPKLSPLKAENKMGYHNAISQWQYSFVTVAASINWRVNRGYNFKNNGASL